MAGHSKWANIKHKKAAVDAKRGKIFTRLIRDIMTAARTGGSGDLADNASLRVMVDKARAANMPKDTIERAIKRGTGEIEGADFVERTYEGYGSGGVAVLVTTLTDNPTRTVTSMRTAFNKNGGNMGNDGAVAWMFKQQGELYFKPDVADDDTMLEAAIDAGADDVESSEDGHMVVTSVDAFGEARDSLISKFGEPEEAQLNYIATQTQAVNDETREKVEKLVAALDDDQDVQDVYTNLG